MTAVLVAGENLVDLFVADNADVTARLGGGPVNVARTLGRLGCPVSYLGRLSGDAFGRRLRAQLAADGVRLALSEPSSRPSALAVVELDAAGQARYGFHLIGAAAFEPLPSELVELPGVLYVGALGLVVAPLADQLAALAAGAGAATLVLADPNCRPVTVTDPGAYRGRLARVLARADVVKVATEDLAYLRPSRSIDDAAGELLAGGATAVLVTDGAGPVRVHHRAGASVMAVPQVTVADTVGAGDAFAGAFLGWWVGHGLGRAELTDHTAVLAAVEAAVGLAAFTCTRSGAQPPWPGELAEQPGWSWLAAGGAAPPGSGTL